MAVDFVPLGTKKIDFTTKADPLDGFHPNNREPNILSSTANAVLGGASTLGVRGGQLIATGVAAGAGALGFKDKQKQIEARLAQPTTNMFGATVDPLKGGLSGVKQVAGAALETAGEAGALLTAPASIPAALGVGAGVGAAHGAGQALSNDASLGDVAKQTGLGAVIGAVAGGAVSGFGSLLGKIGDKIMTSVIRPTKNDIADGFTLTTIKHYDLGGSLSQTLEKTQAKMTELSGTLGEKLAGSTQKIDLNTVVNDTIKELTSASKFKGFGANVKIQNVLDTLKQETSIVGNELSIPEAQVVKQAAGGFGAWQYGKPDPESKATEIVYNAFYNKLKTAIEKSSPEGVKGINQELGKLIPVLNAVLRRLPVAERNNLISLSDMLGLVGSSVNPIALGPTLLNIISKSGRAGNLLSKVAPGVSRAAAPVAGVTTAIAPQVLQQ